MSILGPGRSIEVMIELGIVSAPVRSCRWRRHRRYAPSLGLDLRFSGLASCRPASEISARPVASTTRTTVEASDARTAPIGWFAYRLLRSALLHRHISPASRALPR
jgi:hypothetical protein